MKLEEARHLNSYAYFDLIVAVGGSARWICGCSSCCEKWGENSFGWAIWLSRWKRLPATHQK